jgi:hypothetical protein
MAQRSLPHQRRALNVETDETLLATVIVLALVALGAWLLALALF